MIDSVIRIVDHRGELSSFGRVEYRMRGVWGTICSKGSNEFTGQTICKTMGFFSGKKVNGNTINT